MEGWGEKTNPGALLGEDEPLRTLLTTYNDQSHTTRPRICHSNVGSKYRVIPPNWCALLAGTTVSVMILQVRNASSTKADLVVGDVLHESGIS